MVVMPPTIPWIRPPAGLMVASCTSTTIRIFNWSTDMNDTDTPITDRSRYGQALNDLLIARHIERYYWARGEWHLVLPKGQHLVIPETQIGTWLSGFRCGLRAAALA